jgi:hypothetical protein
MISISDSSIFKIVQIGRGGEQKKMTTTAEKLAAAEQAAIEASLARIGAHKGVYGMLVAHPTTGEIYRTAGFENDKRIAKKWCEKLLSLAGVAASTVRTIDYEDDLAFLRMQWRQRHIIVCPDPDHAYTIIVVQDQQLVTAEQQQQQGQEGLGMGTQVLTGTMVMNASMAGPAGGGATLAGVSSGVMEQ